MNPASGLWRAWLCLLGSVGVLAVSPAWGQGTSAVANRPDSAVLFAAALIDFDDKPANLSAYRGKPTIVNFWARWCGPCKVEIPELVLLQKRKTGVELIGLNLENNPATVRDFASAYEVNYPVLLTREPGIALMQALGNSKAVLPFTVVLNRHGEIVASHIGAMTRDKLDAAVLAALKPVPQAKPAP